MPGQRHTTTSMPINPPSDTWIVLKFGGTSVSRRHRWDTIGRLAKQRADENGARVLVVVSALSGVTNELQAIAEGAHDRVARISALVERHEAFARELDLDPGQVIGERLAALRALGADARAASHPLDWQADVLGQGELLSSPLGAADLHATGLDVGRCGARDWLDAAALLHPNARSTLQSASCPAAAGDGFSHTVPTPPTLRHLHNEV